VFVKTPAKVTGIPAAQVATSPGVTDQGMPQVMSVVSALDTHGFPVVVASLRMSSSEARAVAARMVAAADEAEESARREGSK
jgi:hypothetical protein